MNPNTITCGHVLDVLASWPDECVDMAITSPPYWGLRSYDCPPQIWGGEKDCGHNWDKIYKPSIGGNNHPDRPANVGANRDLNNVDGVRGKGSYSDVCNKCGAWQGHLGLEPDFKMYIDHLMQIFREVRRVLKSSGSLWVNIGDSYWGGKGANGTTAQRNKERHAEGKTLPDGRHTLGITTRPQDGTYCGIKPKSMIGIPERFVIAMTDDGWWILRNKVVWAKQILYQDGTTRGAAMPASVKDRFNQSWEYLYFFTKNKKYYFDLNAVRAILVESQSSRPRMGNRGGKESLYDSKYDSKSAPEQLGPKDFKTEWEYRQYLRAGKHYKGKGFYRTVGSEKHSWDRKGFKLQEGAPGREPCGLERREHRGNYDKEGDLLNHPFGKNPPTVWALNTVPFPGHHFAVYPEALLERPIKACCPPGGLTLDPFMGSGTAALVALSLGRKFVGIDSSQTYVDMARKRIEDKLPLFI